MIVYSEVRKNTYYDSVTLMLISSKLSELEDVTEAAVMMGSDHNKSLLIGSGVLSHDKSKEVSPNDLVIGILAKTQEAVDTALELLKAQFDNKSRSKTKTGKQYAKTVESALEKMDGANFSVVSIPGRFAKTQVMKLLKAGVHVLLFSDNVTISDEVELKMFAQERGLLMMGPDCGTAIVNGVAIGFANVVKTGDIGLIGASGTGLQEISSLIDIKGGGVSQVLGTGGRDLKIDVGGLMMIKEIEALKNDANTQTIGIVSKIPDEVVLQKVIESLKGTRKPVVACFLGYKSQVTLDNNIHYVDTLEEAADSLINLSRGEMIDSKSKEKNGSELDNLIGNEINRYKQEQRYIRGLFSGGTLCQESLLLICSTVPNVYSNIEYSDSRALENVEVSSHHTLLDMGEDYFTDGAPHPMIDFRLRNDRIKKEAMDPETAVILLDCVLGYGSHDNPAGALVEAIVAARKASGDRHVTFISSVTGTEGDPQVRSIQVKKLRDNGVIVMPSCAQAAKLAARIASRLSE